MKTLILLIALLLLSVSLIAQVAPIPQDVPLQQPNLQQELEKRRYRMEGQLLDGSLRPLPAPKQIQASESRPNPSIEDRIAALEAKVQALQKEVETQKAMIEQLRQQLLDQQKKK